MKVIFALFLIFVALSCSKLTEYDKQRIKSAQTDSLTSKTESWDFDLSLVQDGKRSFKAFAAYGFTRETDSGAVTVGKGPVHVQIYDSTGAVISQQVYCDELLYHARSSRVELTGNVRISTRENRRLSTEQLFWNQENKLLLTNGFVTVVTPEDSISGYGLRAKDDLSEYRIKEVSGEVTVEKNNP